MKYDVLIVGTGPAGIFTALELLRNNYGKKIMMIEQGRSLERRACAKFKTKDCAKCSPYCHITSGFSGAGAFSDGKLSLSYEVGGDLPDLIGSKVTQEIIDYTDKIYLDFGADEKIEGTENAEKIKDIRRRAIQSGLKLVDCPIRHLGTEKAREIYLQLQKYLIENGVEILYNTVCLDLNISGGECSGAKCADVSNLNKPIVINAEHIVVAAGRKGAHWLDKMCRIHNIDHKPGTVDIGVRVEVRNEIMEEVNELLYEAKLVGYPKPFKNKVRTFCQNPGGFVSQENYDDNLALVNGHSYKEIKSANTNIAILCSHNFSVPFNEPISYAQKVGKLANMLADGHILVQRYGDILDGKRTWANELELSNVRPTLKDAVAGDISAALPYRTLINILSFIQAMDKVVTGFASSETLLYAPEIKFYSNKIQMDDRFNTNIKNLHCLGDSSGWTRGLMMASVMGVLMGRYINSREL
ncbi:MAG: FAD-dependent protein [Eubacteriaceae bacterium]